jgi:hypothetical protein
MKFQKIAYKQLQGKACSHLFLTPTIGLKSNLRTYLSTTMKAIGSGSKTLIDFLLQNKAQGNSCRFKVQQID